AQQRQDRRGQVQAATAAATGLACFIFRFLRRPPVVAAAAETPMTSPDHGAPQECCITLSCPPGSSLPSTVGGIFDAPVSRLKVE
ncbi:hypothetical protein, partial [Aquabacterium sp.]|uniref:hypothetical protein n=1 Tax=Aquabacterium sp. TaxID=1872578 RepID=UPI0025B7FCB9